MRSRKSELALALASCRGAFFSVGIFSGVINVLMLTGSIYMLQVYDRVLPSRSVPTLIGLTVLIIFLFGLQGVLDFLRQRLLTRVGSTLDAELSARIFNIVVTLPLKGRTGAEGLQPLRDFDTVRGFLSGVGPTALFDLPWLPLYLGLCFLLHPWLGLIALVGALILFCLAVMTEVMSRKPLHEAAGHAAARQLQAESSRRNAEAIKAMGMAAPLARRWAAVNDKYLLAQERAADASGGLGALSKVLRFLLQSLVLGVGAWLAILDMASPGVIIAASILTSRALAPIETAIAHWKSFLAARQSWRRLSELLAALPPEAEPMTLPAPKQSLTAESLVIGIPGSREVDRQQCQLHARGGRRARRHRSERLRQIDARARARRGLAGHSRGDPARRRDAGALEPCRPRHRHRLHAASHRALRRHRRGEHRPLLRQGRSRESGRGRKSGRRA